MADNDAPLETYGQFPCPIYEWRDWDGELSPWCTLCQKWADEQHQKKKQHVNKVWYKQNCAVQMLPREPARTPALDTEVVAPQSQYQSPVGAAASSLSIGVTTTPVQYSPRSLRHASEFQDEVIRTMAQDIDKLKGLNDLIRTMSQESEKLKHRVQELENCVAYWGFHANYAT